MTAIKLFNFFVLFFCLLFTVKANEGIFSKNNRRLGATVIDSKNALFVTSSLKTRYQLTLDLHENTYAAFFRSQCDLHQKGSGRYCVTENHLDLTLKFYLNVKELNSRFKLAYYITRESNKRKLSAYFIVLCNIARQSSNNAFDDTLHKLTANKGYITYYDGLYLSFESLEAIMTKGNIFPDNIINGFIKAKKPFYTSSESKEDDSMYKATNGYIDINQLHYLKTFSQPKRALDPNHINEFDISHKNLTLKLFITKYSKLGLSQVELTVLYYGLGSLIGAAAGDSIGGRLEFWKLGDIAKQTDKDPTEAIDRAVDWKNGFNSWKQVGGGTWQLTCGETTDDTAMGISLARGLLKQSNEYKTIQNNLFLEYNKWANIPPFDIGQTTRNTIGLADAATAIKESSSINSNNVATFGNGALSNGALMRIMPLALFIYKLNNNEIHKLVHLDSELTNNNKLVEMSVTAYVISLKYLILHSKESNRNIKAYERAKAWLQRQSLHQLMDTPAGIDPQSQQIVYDRAANIVLTWLQPIENTTDILNATKYEHAVKIENGVIKNGQLVHANDVKYFRVDVGIQRAFYWLLNVHKYDYKSIIKNVLLECKTSNNNEFRGDTDTNAAIVGGLIGAYYGVENIPYEYKLTLSTMYPQTHGYLAEYQAKWYWTTNNVKNPKELPLALSLVHYAPDANVS